MLHSIWQRAQNDEPATSGEEYALLLHGNRPCASGGGGIEVGNVARARLAEYFCGNDRA